MNNPSRADEALPNHNHTRKTIAALLATLLFAAAGVEAKPLKVFNLAGQSNMGGPAHIGTFDHLGEDPKTAPMLKMMKGADGKPTVCEGAWTSSGKSRR